MNSKFNEVIHECGESIKKIDSAVDNIFSHFEPRGYDTIVNGRKFEMNKKVFDEIKSEIYPENLRNIVTYPVKITGVDCYITSKGSNAILMGCKELK